MRKAHPTLRRVAQAGRVLLHRRIGSSPTISGDKLPESALLILTENLVGLANKRRIPHGAMTTARFNIGSQSSFSTTQRRADCYARLGCDLSIPSSRKVRRRCYLTRTQRTIQILRDPQEVFRWV